MFDVFAAGSSDFGTVVAELAAQRDPARQLSAPVDVVAHAVADAARVLVDRLAGEVEGDALMNAVSHLGEARRFVAAAEAAMVARLEGDEVPLRCRGARTTSWLAATQGMPRWKAAEATQVAVALHDTFGLFGDALGRAEIGYDYCAALVRASTPNSPPTARSRHGRYSGPGRCWSCCAGAHRGPQAPKPISTSTSRRRRWRLRLLAPAQSMTRLPPVS
jgi:hypothetical protein